MEDAGFLYQCQESLKEPIMVSRVYDPTARIYKVESTLKKTHDEVILDPLDVVNTYRSIKLNYLEVPAWLESRYKKIEESHVAHPVVPFNRLEKLVSQRYSVLYSDQKYVVNSLVDGFRMDFKFDNLNLNIELDGPTHRYSNTVIIIIYTININNILKFIYYYLFICILSNLNLIGFHLDFALIH